MAFCVMQFKNWHENAVKTFRFQMKSTWSTHSFDTDLQFIHTAGVTGTLFIEKKKYIKRKQNERTKRSWKRKEKCAKRKSKSTKKIVRFDYDDGNGNGDSAKEFDWIVLRLSTIVWSIERFACTSCDVKNENCSPKQQFEYQRKLLIRICTRVVPLFVACVIVCAHTLCSRSCVLT